MKNRREYNLSEEFNRSYANPIEVSIGSTLSKNLFGETSLKDKLLEITKKLSRALGVDFPQVTIKENDAPNSYAINIFNVQVGKGKIYPGFYIIRDPDEKIKALSGHKGFDPIWGPPNTCIWIHEKDVETATSFGYQVLNGEELIVNHLEFVLSIYQGEFIDPEGFRETLMHIESSHPDLMKKVFDKIDISALFKIIKNLVSEGISLNHLTTVLNFIAKNEAFEEGEIRATEQLRKMLKYEICYTVAPEKILHCIVISVPLQIYYALKSANFHRNNSWARYLIRELKKIQKKSVFKEYTPVLLCIPEIRPLIYALVKNFFPNIIILKTSEVPQDYEISIIDIIEPPLWKIIPCLIIPYILANLNNLGAIWKSTDAYMELVDKSEEEFTMVRISPSFQNRLKIEQTSDDLYVPSGALQMIPNFTSGELTPGQKAAIFLLGSPPWYVKEVLSRLEPRDINSLGKEMAKLAKYSHNYREHILREFPDLDHKCCDAEEAAKFVRASLNGEYYKPHIRVIKKLALLLTSLSGRTGEMVTSAILPRLQKNKLESLIIEINNFKFATNVELKAQVIEEFIMFYKNLRYPQTLLTPPFLYGEIQRISLAYPKEFAHTLQTLWLNHESIVNRFNRWANQDSNYAAFWINRFYVNNTEMKSDFRLLEKAAYLIHSISTELSSGVMRNLKSFSKTLLPIKRNFHLKVNRTQQDEIFCQFLSHFYNLYYEKITQDISHNN